MTPARTLAAILGCLALAGSLFVTIAAALPQPTQVLVLAASLAPLTIPGFVAAVLLLWLGRPGTKLTWTGTTLVLAGLVVNLIWLAPSFLNKAPGGEGDLRVVQFNTNRGRADPVEVKRLLAQTRPDIFVMAEATPDFLREINANGSVGPGGLVPEYAAVPPGEMLGTVAYSKFPISFEKSVTVSDGAYQFRVQAPRSFTLITLHPAEPVIAYQNWKRDFANIEQLVEQAPDPLLVVGDLNVTARNQQLRKLLATGLKDAAVEAGSGWQPTWPESFGWLAVLTLDHVLFSPQFTAVDTKTRAVRGSDHLALVADLRMPA